MGRLGGWKVGSWGVGELGRWGIGELGSWGGEEVGRWGGGAVVSWEVGKVGRWGGGEARRGEGRGRELKCYIHTDIQTYRPFDEAGCKGAFASKNIQNVLTNKSIKKSNCYGI